MLAAEERTPARRPRGLTQAQAQAQNTSHYEKTLADLNRKVEQLSESLNTSAHGQRAKPDLASEDSPHSIGSPRNHQPVDHWKSSTTRDSNFEGDSSFAMHSMQATQALEASLASTPQIHIDVTLSDAMASLQNAVGSGPDSGAPRPSLPAQPSQSSCDDENQDLAALPMPPTDLVVRLLKYARAKSLNFFDECPALDTTAMINYCQRVFFATEPYSIAIFILVNAGLISMLQILDAGARAELQISLSDLARYQTELSENVEVAVQKLPLLVTQNADNITAIFLAVGHTTSW
ncbi:MAG: hypothetical protein Q9177_004650 [Variospora cf. flavescens]